MAQQLILAQRLYQQAAQSIRQQIRSGAFAPGARLPSEKLLAQQLGVSRPTVREAMIALEISGVVEVRSGSGSYVREKQASVLGEIDTGPDPIELLRARMLIEGEIAAEAAMRATSSDLEQIEAAIAHMESLLRQGEHSRSADRSFHVQVARASGNDVLSSVVASLWEGMFSPLFDKLSERTLLAARQEAAIREHRVILSALQTQDALAARAAMRQHLQSVESILANAELRGD